MNRKKGILNYNDKELIFDGEILNGIKWNEKEKEYFKGELVFDGEYFQGT